MGFLASQCFLGIPTLLIHLAFVVSCIKDMTLSVSRWLGFSYSPTDTLEEFSSTNSSSLNADAIRERLVFSTYGEYLCRNGYTQRVSTVSEEEEEGEPCAICLNSFGEKEEILELCNCMHIFHKCCLDKWLDHRHITCPLCRCSLVESGDATELNDNSPRSWALDTLCYLFATDLPIHPSLLSSITN